MAKNGQRTRNHSSMREGDALGADLRAANLLKAQFGLIGADFVRQLSAGFRDAAIDAYFAELPANQVEGESKAEIARRYGVNRSNVLRLFRGLRQYILGTGRRPVLRAENFCVICAANDIVLPRGSHATAQAYIKAFRDVQVKLGRNSASEINLEGIFCLWSASRNQKWIEGMKTGNRRLLVAATAEIRNEMLEYLSSVTIELPEDISSVIDGRWIGWLITYGTVSYAWLG